MTGKLTVGEGPEPKELFIVDPVPLVKVEVGVGDILAPGFKVRVSGGLNMPGYHVAGITCCTCSESADTNASSRPRGFSTFQEGGF